MKKVVFGIFAMLLMAVGTASAQDIYDLQGKNDAQDSERELSRQERKALQERIDSVQWAAALAAVNDTAFTLEADQVIFKYGQRAYVSSSTNFVAVRNGRATVQVAFNVPVAGPNGMGGVTLDGRVSSYSVSTDAKGNVVSVQMDVNGIAISSRLFIRLYRGSNRAEVDVLPNFNSRRISLSGRLLPAGQSFVVKGMSI